MPRRPGRRSRSEPRWSLAEPPPGLFPAGGEDILRFLAVLAIAAGVAAACSLFNRRPIPFCDSDYQYAAYDSCEPCPENGRCVDGKLECVQGFRRRGKICVEDGLLTQAANKIAEQLQRRICDDHALALCGQPAKILFTQLDISNMADELLSSYPARLSDHGVQVVKERVLQSVHGFFETTPTNNGVDAFKCPELVAELHRPLDCQVRQWISRNTILVATFGTLFAALLRILWSIYKRRALSKRAEQIYEQAPTLLQIGAGGRLPRLRRLHSHPAVSSLPPWTPAAVPPARAAGTRPSVEISGDMLYRVKAGRYPRGDSTDWGERGAAP